MPYIVRLATAVANYSNTGFDGREKSGDPENGVSYFMVEGDSVVGLGSDAYSGVLCAIPVGNWGFHLGIWVWSSFTLK